MIALDRSLGLLGIAKTQEGGIDVVRGDLGCRGWRDGVFVRSSFFLYPPSFALLRKCSQVIIPNAVPSMTRELSRLVLVLPCPRGERNV